MHEAKIRTTKGVLINICLKSEICTSHDLMYFHFDLINMIGVAYATDKSRNR